MKPSALQVGVDVPWVTSWTAEAITGVGPCASVGGRLALGQVEHAGYGRPQYSKNHLLRQRLTVARMLCPMCGEPTAPDDRVTQVARRIPAGLLRKGGRAPGLSSSIEDDRILVDAGSIAPLHRRCSDLSLQHCPHLRAEPNVDVRPFTLRWTILPLMIEATAPPPPGHALMRTRSETAIVPVITFLQLCGVSDERDPGWKRHAARYRQGSRVPA